MWQILLLTIIISFLDSIYLFFNKGLYANILPESSVINILYAYLAWFSIALAIYFLIISRPDFSLITALKTAPFLGFAIYCSFNATNMILFKDIWSLKISAIDTLWGCSLITFATAIISFIK